MTEAITAVLASDAHAHAPWQVERVTQLEDFLRSCTQLERKRGEPFQHSSWLRSWYAHLGHQEGVEPLLFSARHKGDAADALLFPMVKRSGGGITTVEWADLGITDYNGPIIREGLHLDAQDIRGLWKALRRAMQGCDVLRLDKTLAQLGVTPNPLLQGLSALPSDLFGNRFRVHDDYAEWMKHLGKHARKEFERCWRVFSRGKDTRFVRARSVDEGLALLRQLASLQHVRRAQTRGYFLDRRSYTDFYEHFLQENFASGRCVVTALMSGDTMVAGLYSIFDGERFTMLRIAMAGEAWKACAPGKLLMERSIAHMHAQGCREFDFAIGDYQHKKVFLTTPLPLREACVALSLRGQPSAAQWRLKQAIKTRPSLRAFALLIRRGMRRTSEPAPMLAVAPRPSAAPPGPAGAQ